MNAKTILLHALPLLLPSLQVTTAHDPAPNQVHALGPGRFLDLEVWDECLTLHEYDQPGGLLRRDVSFGDVFTTLQDLSAPTVGQGLKGDVLIHNDEPRWINVAMLRHHSLDGMPQAGYRGSGAADTALSILAHFLPVEGPRTASEVRQQLGWPQDADLEEAYLDSLGDEDREVADSKFWTAYQQLPQRLYDGHYASLQAWALHQEFKEATLAGAAPGLIQIRAADIQAWIEAKRRTPDAEIPIPVHINPPRPDAQHLRN